MGAYAISKVRPPYLSDCPKLIAQSALNMVAATFTNELYDEGFCCIAQDPG